MSENNALTPSTPPEDEQPTRRVEASGGETEQSDFTRPKIAPPPVGSSPALSPFRPSMRTEPPPSALRQRQGGHSRPVSESPHIANPPEVYPPVSAAYAPTPRSPRRQPRPRSVDGLYFPWWSLVLLVMVVGITALGIVVLVGQVAAPAVPGDQPARIQMITAFPTLSQDFAGAGALNAGPQTLWPTAIPVVQPSPTLPLPTAVPSPSLPPGTVMIGVVVRVVGVEGSGLNIRAAAGFAGSPRFLAAENEQFVVVDGPQIADELEWWRLEDPDNPNRYGWAVRNYLAVVPQ